MTQRRSNAFRPVAIHRRAAGEQADAETAQRKLTFSDLLKQRRVTATVRPRPDTASATPVQAPVPPAIDGDPTLEEPETSVAAHEPRDDAPSQAQAQEQPQPQPTPTIEAVGHGRELAAALTPTAWALDDMAFGLRAAAHASRAGGDEPHPAALALARTVSQFCNDPAVDESEGWQVRMPLRADVLPETTLALSISSYWLQLRFETTQSASRELVLTHRAALIALLESSLNRRREIAIDVE